MSIYTVLNNDAPADVIDYPKLMRDSHGRIYLITHADGLRAEGVFLHDNDTTGSCLAGDYSQGWDIKALTDYMGTVTLSNES